MGERDDETASCTETYNSTKLRCEPVGAREAGDNEEGKAGVGLLLCW